MPRIVSLSIRNFRGLRKFDCEIDTNLVCLIGRGDSGKSSLLDAIFAVLSPHWNKAFYDTDFYNCDLNNEILICASVSEVPKELLVDSKFGLCVRFRNPKTNQIVDEPNDGYEKILTIKLTVQRDLEPVWVVTNNRLQEDKKISAGDRRKLNCFMVSDYLEGHFNWNKGSPLNALQTTLDGYNAEQKPNFVADALRDAKGKLDETVLSQFDDVQNIVTRSSKELGLDISKASTSLDLKSLFRADDRMSLHDGKVPLRLKGKGSRRLVSIAIQRELLKKGGVTLVDEIEQGLEPDRVRLLTHSLMEVNEGQIFITTHSSEVIKELAPNNLLLIVSDASLGITECRFLDIEIDRMQAAIRACPEAFFAKKVIVCEGSTEIGICRAMDNFRKSRSDSPAAFNDCVYINGGGSTFLDGAERIREAGLEVAVLCDSDIPESETKKQTLKDQGIEVFDCEEGNSIETQFFKDLSWDTILDTLQYVVDTNNKSFSQIEKEILHNYCKKKLPESWQSEDTEALRSAIAGASVQAHKPRDKRKPWFKRIDHGVALGTMIFEEINSRGNNHALSNTLISLDEWISR